MSKCVKKIWDHQPINIDVVKYDKVVGLLMEFFRNKKGFTNVPAFCLLGIMAGCEDPANIATFNYEGQIWPLPQTGQMHLEVELLTHPGRYRGLFCLGPSFRNEEEPVPKRHDRIFPIFEFEMPGTFEDLIQLQRELFEFLGFGTASSFHEEDYYKMAALFGTQEIEHEHEAQIGEKFGNVFFLKNFPNYTSPFWNMAQHTQFTATAKKVDTIVGGSGEPAAMETVGAAERSCDPDEMRKQFYTITGGQYFAKIAKEFGRDRVKQELEEFLSLDFFPRVGGGIGVTRLITVMDKCGLL